MRKIAGNNNVHEPVVKEENYVSQDDEKPSLSCEEDCAELQASDGTAFKDSMKPFTVTSHQDFLELIHEMPPPINERELDRDKISDEERTIHADFFEGRPAKNEIRYLKVRLWNSTLLLCLLRPRSYDLFFQIRNHIIDMWKQNRPSYVTKTSVRTGLRNCGDVNCIGRIHTYLEQIGAINFGCGKQSKASLVISSSNLITNIVFHLFRTNSVL